MTTTFSTAGIQADTGVTAFTDAAPSYGISKTSRPSLRTVQFGDGYRHDFVMGLHQNAKVWSLRWENRTETDADAIEAFFDRRIDTDRGEAFNWQAPGEDAPGRYICTEWTKEIPYLNRATITATFQEVYDQ